MEPSVTSAVERGAALITLNRPEVLNALDTPMVEDLIAALRAAGADPAVRAIVLTGAGRGFCAGGDVRAIAGAADRTPGVPGGSGRSQSESDADGHPTELAALVRRLGAAAELLFSLPKPTIAAVNGPCAGAGLSLACAADLRVAARSALFTTAFARVGQSGDYGGIWHLTRLLGSARARELVLLSGRVPATAALDLGLVSAVVADDELLPHALALAEGFAAFAPLTVAALKANLNDAAGDLASYLDREAERFAEISMTGDAREAATAFVEKRAPRFEGR